jgi:ribosomal protein S18 acetylase RimI-like enzyme
MNASDTPDMQIRLSPLDEERFKVATARADHVTAADLPAVNAFCEEENVELLIARVGVQHLDAVQQMEDDGFRLMDTLVYYAFKYSRSEIPMTRGRYTLRAVEPDEADRAAQIARQSFEGYFGHYHADPRLDNATCDAIYTDWANRSARGELADFVFGAYIDDELVSFATMRMNTPDEGEGVLFAVAPEAQGQGIYRAMMVHGMRRVRGQGGRRMVVSTQITNVAVQKVWARIGFEFDRAYYTFHRWFD